MSIHTNLIGSLVAISLGAILTNNFIFSQFLGCCPFLGCSDKTDTAAGMGLAAVPNLAIYEYNADLRGYKLLGGTLDEEAMNLVKYQNAYNLSAKMIQVFKEIYDRLIRETGV